MSPRKVDQRVWAMAMLRDEASEASVSEIRNDLQRYLPGSEVYFPALTHDGTFAWDHAMSQYVFVGIQPTDPVQRLTRSRFVAELVRTPDRQAYELLNRGAMAAVRKAARPRPVRPGNAVRVLSGDCRGLTGRVLGILADNRATVEIQLHSRRIQVQVSRLELERV